MCKYKDFKIYKMKKIFALSFFLIFLISCEKDLPVSIDKNCEICNTECCEQVGTENCCCSEN